jgi:signal transduction histidine kinase
MDPMTDSTSAEKPSTRGGCSPEVLGEYSRELLAKAGSGTPRVHFLNEAVLMVSRCCKCDSVQLVLRDRGRLYHCEALRTADGSYESTIQLQRPTSASDISWTYGQSVEFEQLCRSVIERTFDENAEEFTRQGSFIIGNLPDSTYGALHKSDQLMPVLRTGADCQSLAIVPIDSGQDRIGFIQLESVKGDAFSKDQIESLERFGQTLGIALEHRRLQVALRERVKELSCLYGIARLTAQPGVSIEEILKGTVDLLPPAWLYPEVTVARISIGDDIYETPRFDQAVHILRSDIIIDGQKRGDVEVGYREARPELDEGAFLTEERNLIDTIARELSLIVEQKQAEAEKARLQEQLRHADRLATIGQLAAGVAHELNEPLASILGFAQLSAKDASISQQARQDLQRIVNAALHAREVIRKLLVFARETSPSRSRIDLTEVVEDGLYFLDSRCKKAGITTVRRLSTSLPPIAANRSQMLQVLTNLVVNAIQAMPDGGELVIGTSSDSSRVQLTVEDSGTGMTDEVMKRIFNPFFTTKAVDQGTGLGLSVVHGIVNAHGGTINVRSKVGRGTLFTIDLPIDQEEPKRGQG